MSHFYRIIFIFVFLVVSQEHSKAQFPYGTTGLLHMPTADMQQDKTFLFGGGYLNKKMTPKPWNFNTYNYYVNITFFPWLEIAYDLTLNKGKPGGYWPKRTWGKFVNQDRQFSARFRLWKEGWYYGWSPQIVLGVNDPGSHKNYGGGSIVFDNSGHSNAYFTRFFIAATKHLIFDGVGEIGAHAALIHSRENCNFFTRPAFGANFELRLFEIDKWQKWVNGLNLMAEFDGEGINFGGSYKIWRDNINLIVELHECKYLSSAIYFKLHLR